MSFAFDDDQPKATRYGNSPMDNLLAGEQQQHFAAEDFQQQQQHTGHEARARKNQRESFQQERDFSTNQQRNLLDATEQNTIANSRRGNKNNNLGYDPSEFMVVDENSVASNVNDVNLFVRVMLGLILFFQIFIIFRLFTRSAA